jgi:hypothetical protein
MQVPQLSQRDSLYHYYIQRHKTCTKKSNSLFLLWKCDETVWKWLQFTAWMSKGIILLIPSHRTFRPLQHVHTITTSNMLLTGLGEGRRERERKQINTVESQCLGRWPFTNTHFTTTVLTFHYWLKPRGRQVSFPHTPAVVQIAIGLINPNFNNKVNPVYALQDTLFQ